MKRADVKRLSAVALLGFASGLPFYVQVTLIPAWLRSNHTDLSWIALLAWARVPYVWKFLWAPLLDRVQLPFASRRRDWMLLCQVLLMLCIGAVGYTASQQAQGLSFTHLFGLTLLLAFLGATQDVAIDAYRREILSDSQLGLGNALSVNAYRLAGAVAGGVALVLADHLPWSQVYVLVAGCLAVGVVGVWLAPALDTPPALKEPVAPSFGFRGYSAPLVQLFQSRSLRNNASWLLLLVTYKLGDCLATALLTPFYLDCGFSLTEIGTTVKAVSLVAMVSGSLAAGFLMTRISLKQALVWFGLVQAVAILGLALLSVSPPTITLLALVVAAEYLGMSLSTTAFVAFLARSTSRAFSGTQYALLSAIVTLPQLAAGASAGFFVKQLGYPLFFVGCTLLSLPGLMLASRVAARDEVPAL
jgi:MFS transporter, PAT family, beta-lactamase induction signal transducer AmpG